MIHGKTITLVVPCRNEEKIIKGFLRKVPQYVDEILIVDNGSTDATATIARKCGARVIYENRTIEGIGYGFAHQTGMKKATGDWIVAMDGDDTYPLSSIKKIITSMEKNGIDVMSCNRLPLKHKKAITPTRQLGIKLLNFETKLLFGYPIKDILTGMWILKRSISKELHVSSGDWNFSPELKINALTNPEISFSEYHIQHFERSKEASKQQIWKTGLSHATFLLQKRINLWRENLTAFSQRFDLAR